MQTPDPGWNVRDGDALFVRNADEIGLGVVYARDNGFYIAVATDGTNINGGYLHTCEQDAINTVWDYDNRQRALELCGFCDSIRSHSNVYASWPETVAFQPRRGGCTEGHLLIVPREHVSDAGENPDVTAQTMYRASQIVAHMPSANIITSKGTTATQTAFHLHVHIVPRRVGDGRMLPWSDASQLSCSCT